jgi:hypothetical protein
MSLNKFTDLSSKPWMNIGCNDITCNELLANTDVTTQTVYCTNLSIAGEIIRATPLVYSTTGNSTTGSIYPAITTIVYGATPGMGTLVSTGYKAGDQLQIVTRGIVNSATSSNVVSVYLYGGATQLNEVQISSGAWTTSTDIVVTSIYNFINATQAYFYSTVSLPTDNQNVSYSTINFPATVPYDQTIALSAAASAIFTHINTTITLI